MNLLKSISLTASIVLLLASCTPKPDGGTVEAGDAQEVASATSGSAVFAVSTESSEVTWKGYRPAKQHSGTIAISGGTISVENGIITAGNITIDITAIKVLDIPVEEEGNAKLTNHLLSADFFDAENFPEASFELVRVVPFAAETKIVDTEEFVTENTPSKLSEILVENPTHMITGNLTMRGVTKSVEIPASVTITGNTVSAQANFNIDRTAWDLSYNDEAKAMDKAKDKFIYNTVNVGITLQATSGNEAL